MAKLKVFHPPHTVSAQVHISSPMEGGRACYKDQFEMTCWYPEATNHGRHLVPSPGWKVNGSVLTLEETIHHEQKINNTATKLTVIVTDTFSVNTVVAYSCFLVRADTQLDEASSLSYYGLVILYNSSVVRQFIVLPVFLELIHILLMLSSVLTSGHIPNNIIICMYTYSYSSSFITNIHVVFKYIFSLST